MLQMRISLDRRDVAGDSRTMESAVPAVAAVYQRHDFLAERKNALDRWGDHVAELVRQFQG